MLNNSGPVSGTCLRPAQAIAPREPPPSPLPAFHHGHVERLFRAEVLRMLLQKSLITEETARATTPCGRLP